MRAFLLDMNYDRIRHKVTEINILDKQRMDSVEIKLGFAIRELTPRELSAILTPVLLQKLNDDRPNTGKHAKLGAHWLQWANFVCAEQDEPKPPTY